MTAYLFAWQYATDFNGRTVRPVFWSFMLVHLLFSVFLLSTELMVSSTTWCDDIYSLVSLLPVASMTVRRLHDVGKSGWWGLIIFVPIVGVFGYLYLMLQPSQSSDFKGELV